LLLTACSFDPSHQPTSHLIKRPRVQESGHFQLRIACMTG
jgi:hypothetical protein